MTLDEAILAAVAPTLRVPNYHSVHRQVCAEMGDSVRLGDIEDRIREMIEERTLVYESGQLIRRLRPVPPEHAACRQRTAGEWRGVAIAADRRLPIDELHRKCSAPGWQYTTREGRRKACDEIFEPPEGICWERNVECGRDGWDRFDHTEETYWRRPETVTVRRPEDPAGAEAFEKWLDEHGVESWDIHPETPVVVHFRRNLLEYESTQEHLHGATLVWSDGRGEPDAGWVV